MNPHDFFSKADEARLVKAIETAEEMTTGEIRVHVDSHSSIDVFDAAVKTFDKLGMANTKHRNGVLFYILCDDKEFAVIGDKGIDNIVPEGFWDDICDELSHDFRKGEFVVGLEKTIIACGEKLKEFFPTDEEADNELSNEISYGEVK